MSSLPSGTVTFLFTDIEGSTQLLHERGDGYAGVVAEHRRLLRGAFARNAGVEVDTQGDSFFVAFPSARAAVEAALDAQIALAATPVRVRMGIHTGEPTIADERYVGLDVVLAARICAAGHGGQILLSRTTRDLVAGDLRDLGDHRLKDIPEPVRLYQLGDDEYPPVRSLSWTNLPLPANPLVGRERERAGALELMRREDVRLLTLTGPGGTGKTRLVLDLAAELVGDFEDGVLWVPLVGVGDPALVLSTIAGALGARQSIPEHLGDKHVLLVLDNFEQVVVAAPDLSGLLRSCPRLRLLVTSREPLHIAGEREFPVPTLTEDEAVRLFRARAEAVHPHFTADGAIADICDRLDRLPLAIELAAARVKMLEPDELLALLDRRLPVLVGAARDIPQHQRTLRGTIEWSHELLDPEEKLLFCRLAVFAGGMTRDAAAEVCDATLDGLAALVDKSLLRREGSRFHMLETIREYALDRLDASGEAEDVRRLHAGYFCRFGEQAEAELEGPGQAAWLDAVAAEHDNIRAALEWCLAGEGVELGARLASSLYRFWTIRAYVIEGRRWLDRALAAFTAPPPWIEVKLLKAAGFLASAVADIEATKDLNARRLELARAQGDRLEMARCLNNLGLIARWEEDYPRATSFLQESIALFRELGEPIDVPLGNLGRVARGQGDLERAEALFSEAREIARVHGDLEQVLSMTQAIGWTYLSRGRLAEVVAFEREAFPVACQLGHKDALRSSAYVLAVPLAQGGNLELAAQLFGKAEALTEELADRWRVQRFPEIADADAQIRSGLSEAERLEAMNVGRNADLQQLLEAALREAEEAAADIDGM